MTTVTSYENALLGSNVTNILLGLVLSICGICMDTEK